MEEVYYLKLLIAVVGLGTALVTSAFNYMLYERQSRDIGRALKGVQKHRSVKPLSGFFLWANIKAAVYVQCFSKEVLKISRPPARAL